LDKNREDHSLFDVMETLHQPFDAFSSAQSRVTKMPDMNNASHE